MIQAAKKNAIALGCSILLCGGALAQGTDSEKSASTSPPSVGDEVIVLGKSWGEIRTQIHRAEELVYDRFNEINRRSSLRTKVHCRTMRRLRPT